MIRAAGAPWVVLGLAAGVFIVLVAEARAGQEIGWFLLALPVAAFLAGRAPAWPAGAVAVGLLPAGIVVSQLIVFDNGSIVPELMLPITSRRCRPRGADHFGIAKSSPPRPNLRPSDLARASHHRRRFLAPPPRARQRGIPFRTQTLLDRMRHEVRPSRIGPRGFRGFANSLQVA